jgi:hypothetical protein
MNMHVPPNRWRGVCVASPLIVGIVLSPIVGSAAPTEDLGASLLEEHAQVPELPAARALLAPLRRLAGVKGSAPASDDWLQTVKEHMRQAEQTLALNDATGRASSLQREAVSELDLLLTKLQKQCQKCMAQCNSPAPNQNKPPKAGKPGTKPGRSTPQAAAQPARIDLSAVAQLVKDRWGRLPERQRDEILQPLSEEFVPEYAAETEAYFRALAEPQPPEENQP